MGSAGEQGTPVALAGASSKGLMAGPVEPARLALSTTGLNRVRQYEPRDLTISVEAGVRWCELARLLAANRQMVPLDPPFADTATVGGVVAANSSGPRRRLYGTARDFLIGMQVATLAGKLVQSGGMVVKNVAGLDMAKMLAGSFGTLAAIAVVNFKVVPRPAAERTFLLPFDTAAEAVRVRDVVLKSVLQPAAIDLLNPAAAEQLGLAGWVLALQAGGSPALLDRYQREVAALGASQVREGQEQAAFWRAVQEFTPRFLAGHPDGTVVRVSCPLAGLAAVSEAAPGALVARAGSGVSYVHFAEAGEAAGWAGEAAARGWQAVVEFAPEARKASLELWPAPGGDLELMRRVKQMFDPKGLLNRGRLYGRI